jgi:hypothetical protein
VFKISRTRPWPPMLDLVTVRETLCYMHDDMKRVAALTRVAAALETALAEFDSVERSATPAALDARVTPARFFPRKH